MAAAVLRLLPRRRAATLAPLIPAPYSKPPYPLRAATAAAGLPDARRAQQLCASPVTSSMLRLYASEGCARPAPRRQPAHHQATCRLHSLKVSAATTSVLPGSRCMQLSLLLVPTPNRHFSSMGNVLPPQRKLTDPQAMWYLKVLGLAVLWFMVSNWIHIWRLYVGTKDSQDCVIIPWFFKKVVDLREPLAIATLEKADRLLERLYGQDFSMFDQGTNDLLKVLATYEKGLDDLVNVVGSLDESIDEAIATLEKTDRLLEEGLYDKFVSMIDQGTDHLLKSLAIYEKGLDDLVQFVEGRDEYTLAIQEHLRVSCKELDGKIKIMRQRLKKVSAGFKNRIALRKGAKGYLPRMGSQGLENV